MKLRVRDILFVIIWTLMTIAMGIGFLPALISQRMTQNVARHWAQATFWLLKHLCGISSHVRGYQHISREPVIYASKHQSTWDTFMLGIVLHRAAFILKRELYFIPFFGWYLWRSGQIAINRRDGKQAMQSMIQQAKIYAEQGRALVIFPEGTRTAPNADSRYKSGVAILSAELGLPVVPVALNAGKFWPKALVRKRSGNAVIEFLPAMPPAGAAKDAWLDDLKQRIENATAKLLEQA